MVDYIQTVVKQVRYGDKAKAPETTAGITDEQQKAHVKECVEFKIAEEVKRRRNGALDIFLQI
jgi:hypothetical protein